MSEAVIAALITAIGAIITQVILARQSNKEFLAKLEKQSELSDKTLDAKIEKWQAVTDTKIDELTREVREHNNFARRMPVLEEQIKVANHRIEDLERRESK